MIFQRFSENPLLSPQDVKPTFDGWEVLGAYNCGAFVHDGRIGLLVRVIERPTEDDPTVVTAPLLEFVDGRAEMVVKRWQRNDVDIRDPRFVKADIIYDAIWSHLRLAWSEDGRHFQIDDEPTLTAIAPWERAGIQDPRVLWLDGEWTIIYSGADPDWGVTQSLATTNDWQTFQRKGVIFMPDNKDVALFPEKVAERYCCFARPSGVYFGGHNMWIGYSPDLLHWGDFKPLALPRPGMWDSRRIGCGAEPLRTDDGWLAIYHGSDGENYYLGAMLLDLNDPTRVLARSEEPLLAPEHDYEQVGYFNNVVFSNGLVRKDEDTCWLYYGGADRYTCGCSFSISAVLNHLR